MRARDESLEDSNVTTTPMRHIDGAEGEIRTHRTLLSDSFQDCASSPTKVPRHLAETTRIELVLQNNL